MSLSQEPEIIFTTIPQPALFLVGVVINVVVCPRFLRFWSIFCIPGVCEEEIFAAGTGEGLGRCSVSVQDDSSITGSQKCVSKTSTSSRQKVVIRLAISSKNQCFMPRIIYDQPAIVRIFHRQHKRLAFGSFPTTLNDN